MARTVRLWLEALPKRPFFATLIFLGGMVTALATFSSSLSTIFGTLEDVADKIQFIGVARHYVRPGGGSFSRLSQGYWIETTNGRSERFVFQEFQKDRRFVYLYDSSRPRDKDPTDPLLIRIPIEGGMAQWSYANPVNWTDLFVVCRDVCRGEPAALL